MSGFYARAQRAGDPPPKRVVVLISQPEVEELDSWAMPAGIVSRSEAVRRLIRMGLDAVRSEQRAAKHP